MTRYPSALPHVFIVQPSAYYGKQVRVLRSKFAWAVNAIGVVTVHNVEKGTLCVLFADGEEIWSHTANVEVINPKGE